MIYYRKDIEEAKESCKVVFLFPYGLRAIKKKPDVVFLPHSKLASELHQRGN